MKDCKNEYKKDKKSVKRQFKEQEENVTSNNGLSHNVFSYLRIEEKKKVPSFRKALFSYSSFSLLKEEAFNLIDFSYDLSPQTPSLLLSQANTQEQDQEEQGQSYNERPDFEDFENYEESQNSQEILNLKNEAKEEKNVLVENNDWVNFDIVETYPGQTQSSTSDLRMNSRASLKEPSLGSLDLDKSPIMSQVVSEQVSTSLDLSLTFSQANPCENRFCPHCLSSHVDVSYPPRSVRIKKVRVLFIGDYNNELGDDLFSKENTALIHKMALAMGLAPDDYAMTLAVKCRPLSLDENVSFKIILTCTKHILMSEIKAFFPELVILFGRNVFRALLNLDEKISKVHGEFFDLKVSDENSEDFYCKAMVTFHPDVFPIKSDLKQLVWEDLKKVMAFLKK